MRFQRQAIAAIFILILGGCASKSDFEVMRHDMDELKNRHLALEKEFEGFKSETIEGTERALKEERKQLESIRKGAAGLQAALDGARVDMQALAGKADTAMQTAKKPEEDLSLLKEEMDRRLTALEGMTDRLEKNLGDFQNKITATPPTAPVELSPEALYQQGLEAFKGGNPQKAQELLTKFLAQYPNHALAANAHYWLGEAYYSEKNYDLAILEFDKVIRNYPGKEKVPAAMLKQAMSFKGLGDVKNTGYLLKKLVKSYPRSEEARQAKAQLKKLK